MNPIVLSGLYGIGKGLVLRTNDAKQDFGKAIIVGPIVEESIYRAGLGALGIGGAVGAFSFAVDHLANKFDDPGDTALRFGDTFLGGMIYGSAYKKFGLLGSIAAHMVHNFAVYAIQSSRVAAPTPMPTLGSYRRSRGSRTKRG